MATIRYQIARCAPGWSAISVMPGPAGVRKTGSSTVGTVGGSYDFVVHGYMATPFGPLAVFAATTAHPFSDADAPGGTGPGNHFSDFPVCAHLPPSRISQ